MRVLAWFGGFLAVAVVGAGLVSSAPPSSHVAVSTRLQATSVAGFSLPQNLLPSPSPTPIPVQAVTANPPTRPAAAPAKPPAKPPVVVNSTQQAMINQDRARYHLAPLTWSSCLSAVARYEAAKLATPGVNFQHYDGVNRDLGCHLGRQVGENIGWYSGGINDTWMNSAFMNSPEHKANILGPYRYVATAWAVRSDGRAFIAVEFG
jgi:uncharacterized protein YkwD